jgi:hypothetical protein
MKEGKKQFDFYSQSVKLRDHGMRKKMDLPSSSSRTVCLYTLVSAFLLCIKNTVLYIHHYYIGAF